MTSREQFERMTARVVRITSARMAAVLGLEADRRCWKALLEAIPACAGTASPAS